MNSQMIFKSDDSLRIRVFDCGEKVQQIKASKMVPAPLSFDPRSIAGGESERQCMQVTGAEMLQTEMEAIKDAGRTGSLPRSC
jgi:hypothetical protein